MDSATEEQFKIANKLGIDISKDNIDLAKKLCRDNKIGRAHV